MKILSVIVGFVVLYTLLNAISEFDIFYFPCLSFVTLSQNVPPAILLRFLREHRSEWADNNIDAYSAAAVKVGPCSLAGSRVGSFGGQVILPLAHTIEHDEVKIWF